MHDAFLGIGSNVGDKEQNIAKAISLVSRMERTVIEKSSSLYKTEPVGYSDQDWFVNAVIRIKTPMNPNELLTALLAIEQELGRQRGRKWGPRIIDLDILFYDGLILEEDGLTLPHPHLHDRAFVLKPICEIAPDFMHPVLQRSLSAIYDELPDTKQVIKIGA